MANKPTSLASMVARQEADKALQDKKEDAKLSKVSVPKGKVWVRLIRPCYDAEGVYHPIGAALLPKDGVPPTAILISAKDVEEEDSSADE